jgi:hypothetical protein
MTKGLSSSRVIHLDSNEELEDFIEELTTRFLKNKGRMDEKTESWLDSEFNRIYVTYAYPDVTKVH